jgi:hypothetical protein
MISKVPNLQATESLRLLAQACFGVIIGVLLAVAIARLLLPPDGSMTAEGILPSNIQRTVMKPRGKGFYLLSLVLGGAFGYFATFRIVAGRVYSTVIWLILLLSIPIVNGMIASTLGGAGATVPVATAIFGGGLFAFFMLSLGRPLGAVAPWSAATFEEKPKLWPFFVFLLLMTLVLIPSSFDHVAAVLARNPDSLLHVAGSFVAPSLYFLGHGLLPGTDYFTLYSLGLPWIFHFIMGHSPEQAIRNDFVILIIATWFFYAHLAYLLHWLYRSWTAASIVAITALVLAFAHPTVIPAHLFAPSSTILRYPLLTICALLTGYWAVSPRDPARILGVAAAAATSIFLWTETGIVMTLSAPTALFLVHPWRRSIVLPIGAFLVATLVIFVAELFAIFGLGVFHLVFFERLFDAIFYFGFSGMAGALMSWSLSEWHWLYNLVAPGAMLATLGVVARACGNVEVDRRRAAVLGFLATSALLLLVKFSNQSVAGVWQMSAVGPLSVLGWWCVALLRHIHPSVLGERAYICLSPRGGEGVFRPIVGGTTLLRAAVASIMIVLSLAFLYSPSDERNPGSYGLRAWIEYPSLLKRPFSAPEGCTDMKCIVSNPPTGRDITLIDSRTSPGEQVAIVTSLWDWAYLIAADRPPLLFFVPSDQIFTIDQFERSMRRILTQSYIFTPKGADGAPFIDQVDFKAAVEPLLGTTFRRDGESDSLIAWRRAE